MGVAEVWTGKAGRGRSRCGGRCVQGEEVNAQGNEVNALDRKSGLEFDLSFCHVPESSALKYRIYFLFSIAYTCHEPLSFLNSFFCLAPSF